MMKSKLHLIATFLLISTLAIGQKNSAPHNFDIKDHFIKSEIADWLCIYDKVAWHSSDMVQKEDPAALKKLGAEWFCYLDENNQWHAYFGKLENDEYNVGFHYVIDTTAGKIVKAKDKGDPAKLTPLARVISAGTNTLYKNGLLDAVRWNWYVRYNDKNQIEFYSFPAFQPDGKAVYGGELFLLYDETGKEQKEEKLLMEEELRYFMPDTAKSITLTYLEREKPTLGSVFYAEYYDNYFNFIKIQYKTGFSMYSDGYWTHVPKEEMPSVNQPETKEHKKKSTKKKKKKRRGN